MSLTSAILAGVSGLEANTSALSAISQNISNVDTDGYKAVDTDFGDLVTQANAAGTYSAGGVSSTTVQNVSQQGTTTQTTNPYDLAINGQGLFVTTQSATNIGAATQVLYTRVGSFTPDSSGYLVNSSGLYLQAYPTNSAGDVINNGSLEGLEPVNVQSIGGSVSATTSLGINANLNSQQTVSTAATDAGLVAAGTATATQSATAYDASTNSMTAYVNGEAAGTSPLPGTAPDFTLTAQISDSQGGAHTIQYDFLKSANANQWYVEVQAVPASSIVNASGPAGQIASGTIQFSQTGAIETTGTTLPSSLVLGASGTTPTGTGVSWASDLGVEGQTITVGYSPTATSTGLTQAAATSSYSAPDVNGTAYGSVSSVAINTSGIITATFSNGSSRILGQIPLATFANVDGLNQTSGDAYSASSTSGSVDLQTAGLGGAGTIASSAIESSTVDLSSEFANLIVTQRAYGASSKIITIADQMTQDLLQMV